MRRRAPATGRRVKLLVLHEVRASRGAAALRGKENVIAVLALHLTRFQRARVASRPRFASPEAAAMRPASDGDGDRTEA
jgi:hypothetical protein